MPTKNINLTEHYSEFVEHLIASGRYKNASEVLREGLRLLEQNRRKNKKSLLYCVILRPRVSSRLTKGKE